MADGIPPPPENQALGPRQSLHTAFFLAVALHGGAIIRAPAKLRAIARWLSMDRRSSPGQIPPESPPRAVPVLFNTEQVAATAAALRVEILDGARLIASHTHRPAGSFDSTGDGEDDDDDDGSGHPSDRHLWYPLLQSLKAGDSSRLFLVPGPAGSLTGLPGAYRLSDVHENPWILKAGTQTFPGCELTNETTRIWVLTLKITTVLVCLSKRQLHEQNRELCEELKEKYFAEVAEQSLKQLLEVSCSFSDAIWSDVQISQQLTVFDTLVDVLFNIKGLRFSRSCEVAGIVIKMVNSFQGVIQRTSNDIRGSKESTVHPATFVLIQVLEFFCRNRDMVQSILESGDYNTGPCSDMVNCLISKLKECAKEKFQQEGRSYIFVLNNIYYVLQKDCHPGLLPPSVMSNLVSQADQYVVRYLQEYWLSGLSYLDGDSLKKPRRSSMDKFTEIFFSTCESQMTWKVQTELKEKLREEIVKLIIPKYVKFLEALQESRSSHCPSWIKGMWRAKPLYTAARLEQVIRGLFER